ncbi:MAG: DNA-directed RNA polymerase subunit beta [Candidatus Eisenbacteria bacterium]|uniref:DNA-directed RNA polymerase subunit beta n=1 Tax=Eiseniibacteriota bacterium TaxID=2212470 RepID=A0A948RR65_UNCEI|nr:DNA-directed RNA polymerase subunit beta [Candidatus Eisenbacteria bacterium]MBU1950862.1 DNA-directed RNA polymerase subunit beta [Candidatus Eisenbacteria bacterium]MBU2689508.1 DNA-directed RNA polymerase subunit beta [Candidatus Eisenbacteria bacterium]
MRSFSKIDKDWELELPNLLAVQLQSFDKFLQKDTLPEDRRRMGLQEVFTTIFPIEDSRGLFSLEFVSYSLGQPKYTVEECQERDLTYSVPLKVKLRLRVREDVDGKKVEKEILEPQEVYLGELPLITDKGTFVINGAERVIVSQLHRSPGVFFDQSIHPNGKRLFSARIIPYRGSWVEFSLDVKDILYVHIDRKRKLPATTLLRALGIVTDKDILDLFYPVETVQLAGPRSKKMKSLVGRVAAEDIVDPETGEILLEVNEQIKDEEVLKRIHKAVGGAENAIKVYTLPEEEDADVIRKTMEKDPAKSEEQALAKIYNLIRPGESPRFEAAREILVRLFFNPKRYDLGKVGRYKLNRKLFHKKLLGPEERMKRFDFAPPGDEITTLSKEDFIAILKYLLLLRTGDEEMGFVDTDDIDHLGNRRVRSVGELLSKEFNTGLARMARIIRERMSLQDPEGVNATDFINARTVSAAIQSFFGSSQLSQFMDQTNPLAELTHKRRLSALGPGGLTRERAGFEVRDVHYTHYGRMCPIETPEGPNIGLISSLASYARVNDLGFLETPYRIVKKGIVTRELEYIAADTEDDIVIAQANEPIDANGKFLNESISCRHRGEFPMKDPKDVVLMDVSPLQTVSPAAALIPFLEHDDANRALMGSNMQRQAVPLLKTEAPLVGTGLEGKVARDSGAVLLARRGGKVEWVTSESIAIRFNPSEADPTDEFSKFRGLDVYTLTKFKRSNQDTCINQRPTVVKDQVVEAGAPIADGPATAQGQIALGANILVAFMPWGGYNFEDAILASEGLIKNDIFSSIHIEEFELQVRDTKRGMEEITREIPNVGEDALKFLDEDGIITVGSWVRAGDILVGKVTPKGESDLTPEERLLRAIFGEKAGDVRDASLKAPPGMEGVVIDIKVFSRKEKDETAKKQERRKTERFRRLARKEIQQIHQSRNEGLASLLNGQVLERIQSPDGEMLFRAGRKGSDDMFKDFEFNTILYRSPVAKETKINDRFWQIMDAARDAIERVDRDLEKEIEKVSRGDELPPGVVKLVKVFVAKKRKLSVGDKMAGRHGNKGVVSKILPEEDMPYLPDGTPVQIVLNPMGVPSRMNIGQILETHLGWAAQKLNIQTQTPVFAGATVEEIKETLREAGLPEDGKIELYDGRTGDRFHERVTVGQIYMMKLSHLVDDKIHARSIGPYSLVTQQPLGGKAQFGGQRFGEMEVWALEAYGAAYTLQELLTVKSDDVEGRSRMYEAIVKGDNPPEPGVPESFNVLVRELKSLCLDVQFE